MTTYVDYEEDAFVVVVRTESDNTKTGNVPQVYILSRAFLSEPSTDTYWQACPNSCPHKRHDCYVRAQSIYALRKGYCAAKERGEVLPLSRYCDPVVDVVRLGAFGEPGFLSSKFFRLLRRAFPNATILGYSHAWDSKHYRTLRQYCMASCETEEEVKRAIKKGYRVFYCGETRPNIAPFVLCPNTKQKQEGKKHPIQCAQCRLCCGRQKRNTVHIWNLPH